MGSVGSGVAGEQEFAMKSVGTRTTLPRGPPLSRRGQSERSFSAERLPPPPSVSEGTCYSDERGGSSTTMERPQLAGSESTTASSNLDRVPSIVERLESNMVSRRVAQRALVVTGVDARGKMVIHTGDKGNGMTVKFKEGTLTKANGRAPPKILPMSGKAEQVICWSFMFLLLLIFCFFVCVQTLSTQLKAHLQ